MNEMLMDLICGEGGWAVLHWFYTNCSLGITEAGLVDSTGLTLTKVESGLDELVESGFVARTEILEGPEVFYFANQESPFFEGLFLLYSANSDISLRVLAALNGTVRGSDAICLEIDRDYLFKADSKGIRVIVVSESVSPEVLPSLFDLDDSMDIRVDHRVFSGKDACERFSMLEPFDCVKNPVRIWLRTSNLSQRCNSLSSAMQSISGGR